MDKNFILMLLFIIFAVIGLFILRPQKKQGPTMEYENLMNILDTTIQREIKIKYDDYVIRNVKFPADYAEEVREISHRIIEGVSPFILSELEFFHTRKYILNKINKDVQKFLIMYMQENKPITK